MDFKQYSTEAAATAIYPRKDEENFLYPVLGLVGETGEVAEKIKKVLRDQEGKLTERVRQQLKAELGDVLWYWATLCRELNLDPAEVAQQNLDKLSDRARRGKLGGSGDDR